MNMFLYQTLEFIIHENLWKSHTKIINLKYQLTHGMKNFIYFWWIIFYIIYSRLFWIYLKKHREKVDDLSIRIYVNKIQNRTTFKIKTGYYLKLLALKTLKILASIKN